MIPNFTPEQDQYLQIQCIKATYAGIREGIEQYAHWRDGVQYVGTCGTTLKTALERLKDEERTALAKYKQLAQI